MSQPELEADFLEDQANQELATNQVDTMLSTLGLTLNLRNYIWASFTEDEIALLQANLHLHDRNAVLGLILPLFVDGAQEPASGAAKVVPTTKLEGIVERFNTNQQLQVRYYFGSLTYRYLAKLERVLQQARRERVCGLSRNVEIVLVQSPYLFNYCRSLDDEYLQHKRQQQLQHQTLNNIRTQMQLEAAKQTLAQGVVDNLGGQETISKNYLIKPYSPLEVENHEQIQAQIARTSLKFLATKEPQVAQALQGVDIELMSYQRLFELLQTLQWTLPNVPEIKSLINQLAHTAKVTEGQLFDTWQLQQSISRNANVVNFGGEFSAPDLQQRLLQQDITNLAQEMQTKQHEQQDWKEFGYAQYEGVQDSMELPDSTPSAPPMNAEVEDNSVSATQVSSFPQSQAQQVMTVSTRQPSEGASNPLLPQGKKLTLAQRARLGRMSPSQAIQQGINFVAYGADPFGIVGVTSSVVSSAQSQHQNLGQTTSFATPHTPNSPAETLTWEQRLELGSRTIFVTDTRQIPDYYCSLLVLSLAQEDRSKLKRTPYTQENATFAYFSNAFGRKEDYSKFKGVLERQQQQITQELDLVKRVRRLHNQTLTQAQTEQLQRQVNDILVNYVYNQNTIPVHSSRVELLEKRLEDDLEIAEFEAAEQGVAPVGELGKELRAQLQGEQDELASHHFSAAQEAEIAQEQLERLKPGFLDKYFTQNLLGEGRKLFENSYLHVAQQLGHWQEQYLTYNQVCSQKFAPLLQSTQQQLELANPLKWFRVEASYNQTTNTLAHEDIARTNIVSIYSYAWQLGQLLAQVQVKANEQLQGQELTGLQYALHCDSYLRMHGVEVASFSNWQGVMPRHAPAFSQGLQSLHLPAQPSLLLRILFQFYIKQDLVGFLVALLLQQPATAQSYLGINQLAIQQLAQQDLMLLFHPRPPQEFLRWSGGQEASETGFQRESNSKSQTTTNNFARRDTSSGNFSGTAPTANQESTELFTQAADKIIKHLEQMLDVNRQLLGTPEQGQAQAESLVAREQVNAPGLETRQLPQGEPHSSTPKHSSVLSRNPTASNLTAFGAVNSQQDSVFAIQQTEPEKLSATQQLDEMLAKMEDKQELPLEVRYALADYQQRLESRAAQVRQHYLAQSLAENQAEQSAQQATVAAIASQVASNEGRQPADKQVRASSATSSALEMVAPLDLTESLDRLLEGDYSQADFSSLEQERQAFLANSEKRRMEMFVSDSIEAFRKQIRTQVYDYLPEILNEFYATLDFKNLGKQVRVYLHHHDPHHQSLPLGFGSQGYLQHLEELSQAESNSELASGLEVATNSALVSADNLTESAEPWAENSELAAQLSSTGNDQDLSRVEELDMLSSAPEVATEHDYLSEPVYSKLQTQTVSRVGARSALSFIQPRVDLQTATLTNGVAPQNSDNAAEGTSTPSSAPDLETVFAAFSFDKLCLPPEQQFTIGTWTFDLKYLTCTYLYLELQQWRNLVEFYQAYKLHRKALDKAAYEKFYAVLPLEAVAQRIFELLQRYIDVDLLALHKVYTLEDYAKLEQKYQGHSSAVKQYRMGMKEQVAAGFTSLHKFARDWARPPRELKILKEKTNLPAHSLEHGDHSQEESALSASQEILAPEVDGFSPQNSTSQTALPSQQKVKLQHQVVHAMHELQATLLREVAPEVSSASSISEAINEPQMAQSHKEAQATNSNVVELVDWEVDFDKLIPDFERQLQEEATKLRNFMLSEYQLPEVANYLEKASNNTELILSRLEVALEQQTASQIAAQEQQLRQQLAQARSLLAQGMSMQQRQFALVQAQGDLESNAGQLAAQQQQLITEKVYQLQQQIDSLKQQLHQLAQPREQVNELQATQEQQVWLDLGNEYARQIQLNDAQMQNYQYRLQEMRQDLISQDLDATPQDRPGTSREHNAQRLMQQKLTQLELFRVVNLDLSDTRLSKKLLTQLQREKEILAFAQSTNQDASAMLFKSQENYLRELAQSKTRRQKGKIYETVYFGYDNNPTGEYVYPVAQKVITHLKEQEEVCSLRETPWLQHQQQLQSQEVSAISVQPESLENLPEQLQEQGNSANLTSRVINQILQDKLSVTTTSESGGKELTQEFQPQVLAAKPQYDYSRIFKKARQALQEQEAHTHSQSASAHSNLSSANLGQEASTKPQDVSTQASDESQLPSSQSALEQETLAPAELESLLRKLLGIDRAEQDQTKEALLHEFEEQHQQQLDQAQSQLDNVFATWQAPESVSSEQPSRVQARLEQLSKEELEQLTQRVAQQQPRSVLQRFQEQQTLRAQGLEVIDGRYFTVQDAIAQTLDAIEAQEQQQNKVKRKRLATRKAQRTSST